MDIKQPYSLIKYILFYIDRLFLKNLRERFKLLDTLINETYVKLLFE